MLLQHLLSLLCGLFEQTLALQEYVLVYYPKDAVPVFEAELPILVKLNSAENKQILLKLSFFDTHKSWSV